MYCEQGTGDMIQFVRYVPRLTAMEANVILDVPPSLETLFTPFGKTRIEYRDEPYDYHCSILSLIYLLNIPQGEYAENVPYLEAQPLLDMTDYASNFKIGIVWAGNPGHPNDINRSCHLSLFRKIANLPNVKLFSLQKETSKRVYSSNPNNQIDLSDNCDDLKVVDMADFLIDYKATASVVNEMDLIITVDTSVLHLAGALGKETWGLIPYNPDWRWQASGSTNVWYPSVILYRQQVPGDWESVFEKIYQDLRVLYHENLLSN